MKYALSAVALGAALALAACATNPVTGQREYNLMSEAQEAQLGLEMDPQVRAEMGLYPDAGLQEYVHGVGMRLAKASERPDLPWRFAVVDVPAVNAFALPGGYIYITRGLLAHLDSEAELAGVLGHEIGHVTARHAARAYTRQASVGIGAAVTSIFFPEAAPYAAAAQTGLGVLFLKYDRNQEVQSDSLGARYAAKEGWQPAGMAGVLETLGRISGPADRRGVPNWLATHPQPADRVARVSPEIEALAATRPAAQWTENRDEYLKRLDGLLFGDNPREGLVRGREFIHPDMRFRLAYPEGWKIENGKEHVTARPAEIRDAMITLELVPDAQGASLDAVAGSSMSKAGFTRLGGESTRLNGIPAYVGVYDGQVQDGTAVRVRAAHIRLERQVLLLAGIASRSRYPQAERVFAESIRSFGPLDAAEAARIKPNRLGFTTVRNGDTWQGIADRTGGLIPASDLAVLNGFAANETPPAGQRIKIVIAGE
jgi:predicted Zn-dependent protease